MRLVVKFACFILEKQEDLDHMTLLYMPNPGLTKLQNSAYQFIWSPAPLHVNSVGKVRSV